MLSTGSLSAFSSANLVGTGIGGTGGVGVTPVRDVRLAPPGPAANTSAPIQTAPQATAPGQVLPRGSLLNLSV